MICPRCGRETTGKFCPSCGTKLNVEATEPRQPDPAGIPNQAYVPKQSAYTDPASNESYASNQGYASNQAYASNQGYVSNPSYAPSSQMSGYQAAPVGALGQPPAIQMLRKVATSPVFLLAILMYTLSNLFSVFLNAKGLANYFEILDYYKGSRYESQIVSSIVSGFVSILLALAIIIALWSIYAAAASKTKNRPGTGGLTFFKVLYVIYLIGAILCLILVLVLLVMLIASKKYSDFFQDAVKQIKDLLMQAGYEFPDIDVALRTFRYIFLGTILVTMILLVIYFAKIIKSLNTAKRVIKTGMPDDRVSVFVGVMTILSAIGSLISGIGVFNNVYEYAYDLGVSRGLTICYGIMMLVSAVSTFFFALTLFRFRAGMRSLGVYKGVMQR